MPKFCTKCGTGLKEDDVFCPECGAKINGEAPKVEREEPQEEVVEEVTEEVEYEEPVKEEPKRVEEHYEVVNNQQDYYDVNIQTKNTVGLTGFILSFIVPIAGLICSIIGLQKAKELNDNSKGMCLAGIIISSVLMVVGIIILIVWLVNNGGSSTPSYYGYY